MYVVIKIEKVARPRRKHLARTEVWNVERRWLVDQLNERWMMEINQHSSFSACEVIDCAD